MKTGNGGRGMGNGEKPHLRDPRTYGVELGKQRHALKYPPYSLFRIPCSRRASCAAPSSILPRVAEEEAKARSALFHKNGGFTLLEVLASLVLLALLLVGVYSGIRTATHSVRSGTANIERIDQIRSAQQFLRRELAQSLTQPIGQTDHGEPIYFDGSAREMRYVAPLPGYLGKLGPQLQRLQLVDDDHGGMRLELSLALLPPDGKPPQPLGEPQVLFDHIRQGSFHYRGVDAKGAPVPWSASWADGRLLPQLVRIELQAQGRENWPTLNVPLRVNPVRTGLPRAGLRGALR